MTRPTGGWTPAEFLFRLLFPKVGSGWCESLARRIVLVYQDGNAGPLWLKVAVDAWLTEANV